jgi:hypothetical protein
MSDPYVNRPNVIARYKEKKFGRQYMLFGQDGDVDAMSRSSQRTMYDGDLLIQGDLLVSWSVPVGWTYKLTPVGKRTGLYVLDVRYRYGQDISSCGHDRKARKPALHSRQ